MKAMKRTGALLTVISACVAIWGAAALAEDIGMTPPAPRDETAGAAVQSAHKAKYYRKYMQDVPIDMAGQMLSPDVQVRPGATVGTDFRRFGNIALVSALGYGVRCDGFASYVGYGVGDVQIMYVRQEYNVTVYTAAQDTKQDRNGNIYKIRYAPRKLIPPWDGYVAFGADFYNGQGNHISRPYVATSVEWPDTRLNLGYGWYTGTTSDKDGSFFSSLHYSLNEWMTAYADYSTRDFQKIILNEFIIPETGVDCEDCTKDAFNAGISVTMHPGVFGSFGVYDIGDIRALFGSVSINHSF